jgi:hypothetical protein
MEQNDSYLDAQLRDFTDAWVVFHSSRLKSPRGPILRYRLLFGYVYVERGM